MGLALSLGLGLHSNGVLESVPNGNPSNVVLTILSDTSIQLDWTNGATNLVATDGTYIFQALSGGDFTLKETVYGETHMKLVEGLTENTSYDYKVVHFKGSRLSGYSNIVTATTQIPSQSDLLNWYGDRSGFTLLDKLSTNNINILTPVFKGDGTTSFTGSGGVIENVCDGNSYTLFMRMIQPATKIAGTEWIFRMGNNSVANRGTALAVIDTTLYFYYSDGTSISKISMVADINSTLIPAGLIDVFIEVDIPQSRVRCRLYKQDGSTVGTNVNLNISTYSFGNNSSSFPLHILSKSFGQADLKKFNGLKSLAQCKDNSYVVDIQLYYPEILSGTDVSGNNHHLIIASGLDSNRYYSSISRYCLDRGYSIHKRIGQRDIIVPNDINGNTIDRSGYLTYNGDGAGAPDSYKCTIESNGSLTNHNLSDSLIEFTEAEWDRSNETIFNDGCRASAYYDSTSATTKKRWHISELNKITLNSYTNINHQGLHFPKISNNSFDDRNLLNEILLYSTNKTGSNLTKVYIYTGDFEIPDILSLSSPYSDIIKITALEDSEFKFNINNSIVYTKQDVYDKIDSMVKLNSLEDDITTMFNWIQSNVDINLPITDNAYVRGSIIHTLNSYAAGECGSLALAVFNILNHYYPNHAYVASAPSHITNYLDNAYIDAGYQFMLYKGRYIEATVDEIKNDAKLVTEPLRQTGLNTLYSLPKWDNVRQYARTSGYEIVSNYDTFSMKLPATATFTYPYKSTNSPKNYLGASIYYGSGLTTVPSGIIGNVSMPFSLTQITGEGSVIIDNITYNLPADNATIKILLQGYQKFYSSFEILTNTGGISAEYIINPRRMLLYNYNRISKGIISGDVIIESIATVNPIPVFYINVNKKLADSWTINHDENKKMSGLFKIPIPATSNYYTVTYNTDNIKNPIPVKISNTTANSLSVAKAGVSVVDKCFASILTPKQDSFSITLELSFVSVDESSTYYTLDESTPDATKTLYTIPFTISATTTVKWINIKTDYANSHINLRVITKI